MRRLFISFALLFAVAYASAQHVESTDSVAYLEALRMARETSENTSKSLEERKIARFKFINAYEYQLTISNKKSRQNVIETFKQVSLANPLFNDPNKEYVLAYITNEGYLTKFSLDTDWVAAYKEIERIYSAQ